MGTDIANLRWKPSRTCGRRLKQLDSLINKAFPCGWPFCISLIFGMSAFRPLLRSLLMSVPITTLGEHRLSEAQSNPISAPLAPTPPNNATEYH